VDNYLDQSRVAYGTGPKEENKQNTIYKSKQFGKGDKMPQSDKAASKAYVKEKVAEGLKEHNRKYHRGEKPYHGRHKEHR
jgi:hypothetical protein